MEQCTHKPRWLSQGHRNTESSPGCGQSAVDRPTQPRSCQFSTAEWLNTSTNTDNHSTISSTVSRVAEHKHKHRQPLDHISRVAEYKHKHRQPLSAEWLNTSINTDNHSTISSTVSTVEKPFFKSPNTTRWVLFSFGFLRVKPRFSKNPTWWVLGY